MSITESTSENTQQPSNSKRNLLLLLAVFILPIILAKLALEQQWFNYGVTNKGQLIAGKINLTQMGLNSTDFNHKWLMIYLLPKQCHNNCQQVLHHVNNTYIALGKEMSRVALLALTQTDFGSKERQQIDEKRWLIKAMPSASKLLFTTSQVLIVDPLGNVVVAHQPPKKQEYLLNFGKAILADFKKLLKYSKVG